MASTLLLAHDGLDLTRIIEVALAGSDIRVVAFADGREAMQQIVADPPDIILADVTLREHSGYEIAALVKNASHLAHIPVLLLAGPSDAVDDARARNVRSDGVLVAPLEPQAVAMQVRSLLANRGGPAQPGLRGSLPDAPAGAISRPEPQGTGGNYLDRLDAAFAVMIASPHPVAPPAVAASSESDDVGVEPPSSIGDPPGLSDDTPLASPETGVGISPVVASASTVPSLSEVFAALLAAERGVPLASGSSLPGWPMSDTVIDEIARRVMARLDDQSMRREVLNVAERLVREEIARIKGI